MSPAVKVRSSKSAELKGKKAPEVVVLNTHNRVIRDPEFAKRFTKACDGHHMVPAKHNGRLVWIQRELKRKFNEEVSVETVRKWFAGEAKPRPDKMEKLAQLLEVDMVWLSLGVDADLQPRERRMRNAMADGAVNLVAGLIQMDGGFPAFPEESDKAAARNHIDLHAIIKGGKYDFHVSLAEVDGRKFRFVVPTTLENVIVLGVVKRGFSIEIIELTSDMIAEGDRRGGSIEMLIDESKAKLKKIESFKARL